MTAERWLTCCCKVLFNEPTFRLTISRPNTPEHRAADSAAASNTIGAIGSPTEVQRRLGVARLPALEGAFHVETENPKAVATAVQRAVPVAVALLGAIAVAAVAIGATVFALRGAGTRAVHAGPTYLTLGTDPADELGGPDIASMSRLTRTAFALSPDRRRSLAGAAPLRACISECSTVLTLNPFQGPNEH